MKYTQKEVRTTHAISARVQFNVSYNYSFSKDWKAPLNVIKQATSTAYNNVYKYKYECIHPPEARYSKTMTL